MSDEQLITIEIDGAPYRARRGAMLIEVTDACGVDVPRFCYHKKLSVAANCRMCLVEVEKAAKPLPACATPVQEGMKVSTRSPLAIAAQRGTMEFLLINHPLDCPICDQGGECELQDVAMGFGEGVSRYTENKRVVRDKDIGSLVATEMTRCIHCTRCVRFSAEIAGLPELGATGRGENMRIGTYVEHTLSSELSGNIIDLCPVGALTAKPSRFDGRAWEMIQQPGIGAHDCVGSNVYMHTLHGKVVRVVPRDNESVNETWLSDRDRFSYQSLQATDRIVTPQIKRNGRWHDTDWNTALQAVAEGLRGQQADEVGGLLSPNATVEEAYLFQKLLRGLGTSNVDHRLRQTDTRDDARDPLFPWLGQTIESLEKVNAALLIGSNVRKQQPLLAHRLRKAGMRGARIMDINPRAFDFTFPLAERAIVPPQQMVAVLVEVLTALCEARGERVPAWAGKGVAGTQAQAIAHHLMHAQQATVLLGQLAIAHPDYSRLRALSVEIAARSDARIGYLTDGANAAGAWLAGAVPHRMAGGQPSREPGLDAQSMLAKPRQAYLLCGLEPELDCEQGARAFDALMAAKFVAALSPFAGEGMREYADVILPVAAFAETSGTYVNAEGRWQSFNAAVSAPGEVRPAWRVLRVLGNLLDLPGFEFMSSEDVREEVKTRLDTTRTFDNALLVADTGVTVEGGLDDPGMDALMRASEVGAYVTDASVRRSPALQATPDAYAAQGLSLHPADRARLGLETVSRVRVEQAGRVAEFELNSDAGVPEGVAWLPIGSPEAAQLGAAYGAVKLMPVAGGAA
ncbi:NADH-quinone oxidoreductase subunit NuoG [Acidihalobacter prosperus]|uniref:NADH-quinone oxidoreductase n=1 Tax=Acidihalobacter prosperus TaxID=160660 RepID=A0A1A6C724_9GAMM|nr:NADH-quinone oxidoreductase subunit NuoG [Acidihalobacter prosperus]OBS10350.1 NADH-ubiquinone oxidoreductase chain G [Acidihalobacter prosperus]